MIAITGANGNLGRATIDFLLKKVEPGNIIAIVRDPVKVEDLIQKGVRVRAASYDNLYSLTRAFENVTTLLQISTTSIGHQGVDQEKNVVVAAEKSNVRHIIYTSSVQPSPNAHFMAARQSLETEKFIKSLGISYTFFRNSLYMEVLPQIIGNLSEINEIRYPAGSGKISFVSRTDIAEAISNVLQFSTKHTNAEYNITGNKAYTFGELANLLKSLKKSGVAFLDIAIEEYRSELLKYNIPPEVVELLVSMADGIKHNEFKFIDTRLEILLGRTPLTLREYLISIV